MMSKFARFLGVAGLLACAGLLSMAQDPKTVASIEKQANDAGKQDWKTLSGQGEALAKVHDLADVMNLFKLRRPARATSGLGVGPMPGAITPDGIEAKIISLSKNPLPATTLEREQAALIRLAEITAAIASVSVHQCTVAQQMGAKNPADWKKWSEELHTSSLALLAALKAKKPDLVRDAASSLKKTCTECHTVFR